ncbi:MAG TPA: hypothetical protein PLR25_11050 [Planctomycetaceae bacterium]|nr:hypothetical protein [Planctomycetaceae bacterium]
MMDETFIGGWVCFLPVVLAVSVLLGAVLLRASVGIANRILGVRSGPERIHSAAEFGSISNTGVDESNPFSAPTTQSIAASRTGAVDGIRQPNFLGACGIVFVSTLLSMVAGGIVGTIGRLGHVKPTMNQLNSQIVGIGITLLIYKIMLPTSVGRAVLLFVLQVLIGIVIAVVVLGIFFGGMLLLR